MSELSKAMGKVYRVINSCVSIAQLCTAKKMLENYEKIYGRSCLLTVFFDCKKEMLEK